MKNLSFDKKLIIPLNGGKICYAILYGNEKIVFIKAGYLGSISGKQDKYLRMAHRIRARIGATVICASNPDVADDVQVAADKFLVDKVIADCGFENCEMYFVGTSDGGYISLLLAQQIPGTVRYLGINSSHKGIEDYTQRILSLPQVKKILVYGDQDDDFDVDVPVLKALACDDLELVVIEGADHKFTGKVDEFIALSDLL